MTNPKAAPAMPEELRRAWADRCGIGYDDDRGIEPHLYGWPDKFDIFKDGWKAHADALQGQAMTEPKTAPQPSTAELQAAPSQEGVGQGEVASAAPAMPVYCHTLAALADEYAEAAARHRTGEKSENYVDTKRAALIAYFAEIEALQAKLERAQAELAKIMIAHSFATGHGDTIMDLLGELRWQLEERAKRTSG